MIQRVLHEFHGLLLNIIEGTFLQVANHVWRDAVETGNLIELEFPGFEELCFFRRDADLLVLHAFFHHSHLMGISRPPIDGIPGVTDFRRVLEDARMRTQAYTAVVCMAVNSLTCLSLDERPNR